MYFLEYLKTRNSDAEAVEVEYRLACSGELYNRTVLTADWRKSDITRVLLRDPFELFVVGQFEQYPQELCARLKLSYVTEENDSHGVKSAITFLPDDEIIDDLCSILSVLARRLISVVGKTWERRAERDTDLGSYGWDAPVSILRHSRFAVWRRRPITIMASMEGLSAQLHELPPTGVDAKALREVLLKLPDLPKVEEIIYACRFYKTALELIESRPDITYQLLISAVETMGGVALRDYKPDEALRLSTALGVRVFKKAQACGLDEEHAKALALEACGDRPSARQRFQKFILDNVSAEEIDGEDPVFPWWRFLKPARQNFEKTLGRIYGARSGNLHSAYPFPPWIGLGTSSTANPRDTLILGLAPGDVPLVTWFERVVSTAMRRYLLAQCSVDRKPFSDTQN
jgi:hypothetical protein